MNRRQVLKLASLTAAALAAGATAVTMEGCTFNITDAINTVLSSALAIIKVAEPGAPWVAPLASAIAALQQAETSWQSGGAATLVIDALNTIEAVLAVIPVTATYAPLISILFAGIEAVMAAFGLTAQLSAAASAKRPTIINSPYYGKTTLTAPNFWHPSWTGAYRHQWNQECDTLRMPQARI